MWFDTLLPKLVELKFKQSDVDPCYWYKVYADGSRFDLGIYVDDMWAVDDAGALADADWAALKLDFKFTVQEDPKQFLNMNVTVESEWRVKFSMEAYVLRMADTYVPEWRSWPKLDRPATEELQRDYETAHAERGKVQKGREGVARAYVICDEDHKAEQLERPRRRGDLLRILALFLQELRNHGRVQGESCDTHRPAVHREN